MNSFFDWLFSIIGTFVFSYLIVKIFNMEDIPCEDYGSEI